MGEIRNRYSFDYHDVELWWVHGTWWQRWLARIRSSVREWLHPSPPITSAEAAQSLADAVLRDLAEPTPTKEAP